MPASFNEGKVVLGEFVYRGAILRHCLILLRKRSTKLRADYFDAPFGAPTRSCGAGLSFIRLSGLASGCRSLLFSGSFLPAVGV
jgi:hypothetical protein